MEGKRGRVVRQGRIYRFRVLGTEYAAFIWKAGSQFCGRIEDNPRVPEYKARTALAVRDHLSAWISAEGAKAE
jgi:hypothetical protein